MSIVVSVEGVLRKLTDGQRIHEGVTLIQELHAGLHSLIFLTTKLTSETETWIRDQGIESDLVLGANKDRVQQLHKIRNEYGYPVDMVIEPDPSVCAELVAEGYMTLGFFHPHFSQKSWRPDFKLEVRPWEELAKQVEESARMKNQVDDTTVKGRLL